MNVEAKDAAAFCFGCIISFHEGCEGYIVEIKGAQVDVAENSRSLEEGPSGTW